MPRDQAAEPPSAASAFVAGWLAAACRRVTECPFSASDSLRQAWVNGVIRGWHARELAHARKEREGRL